MLFYFSENSIISLIRNKFKDNLDEKIQYFILESEKKIKMT